MLTWMTFLFLLHPAASFGDGFWPSCKDLVRGLFPRTVLVQTDARYLEKWERFLGTQKNGWMKTLSVGPESELGLSRIDSENLLRAAFATPGQRQDNPLFSSYPWEGKKYALISKTERTDGDISEFGRIQKVKHQPRFEEMAWAVDLLFGLNIMAPVVSNQSRSVGLMIPSTNLPWSQAKKNPQNLPFSTLVVLLDFLVANIDRLKDENFRISEKGRPFAFDFDVCRRDLPMQFQSRELFYFSLQGTGLLPLNDMLRVPGVLPRVVYEKLKAVSRAQIEAEFKKRQISYTQTELSYLYQAVQIALEAFDEMIKLHGENLILI